MIPDARQYLLLDVGGQSARAQVRDAHGQLVANARRGLHTADDGAGRVSLDAAAVLAATREVIEEVAAAPGVSPGETLGAALSVQRGSVVCWDAGSGEALSPVFSWRDRRGWPEVERDHPDLAERVRRITALRHSPYGGAGKLRWSLESLEPVRRAHREGRLAAGPLGSFLLHGLLREKPHAVDDSLAQRTLLWSWQEYDWSPELLKAFGIPREILPTVRSSRASYGYLDAPFAGVPLTCLVGDQNALADLAAPNPDQSLMINAGTGAFMLRPLAQACLASGYQTSFLGRGDNGDRFALEASIHGAASAFHWLAAQDGEPFEPQRLDGLREARSHPPLFRNAVDGLGSPWWDPAAEPGFVGDGDGQARLLAVVESIAFLVRLNLERIEQASAPIHAVRLSGGLSQSACFRGLLADLLGRPVYCLEEVEGSLFGIWCALAGPSLPEGAWSVTGPESAPELQQRYRDWCAIMPPVPELGVSPLARD